MYAQNKDEETPLGIIIQKGDIEAAKIYLDAGASRDHTYYDKGIGPLHMACSENNLEMVKLFIDAGYEVSSTTEDEYTPLHMAIVSEKNNEDKSGIVKLLIEAGADVNKKKKSGFNSLFLAVDQSCYVIIDILLKAGADINVVDNYGNTMLYYVYDVLLAKQLIDAGININKVNNIGQSSIRIAIQLAKVELLTFYIKHGAAINEVDCNNIDLLCAALLWWGGRPDYEENVNYDWESDKNRFLNWDKTIESRNGKGSIKNQIKCIEIMCKHGFNINRIMKNGNTLFCVALVAYSHTKIVRALLSNGLKIDFNNFNVRTIMNQSDSDLKHQHILIRHAAICNLYKNGKGIVNFDLKTLNEKQVCKYQNCIEELKILKEFIVYEDMSLFNLIEGPVTSRYILNENLMQLFKTGLIAKSFPMFNDILIERFENEHKKYKLMLEATAGLKVILKFNEHSYDLVYRNILQYLGTNDQRILASLANIKTSEFTDML